MSRHLRNSNLLALLLTSIAAFTLNNMAYAASAEEQTTPPTADCDNVLRPSAEKASAPAKSAKITAGAKTGKSAVAAKKAPTIDPSLLRAEYTLDSFLTTNDAKNLALINPFTVMNAAEKQYAMMTHVPARNAVDPLYRVKRVTIHPILSGESEASGGRMVVGQEESIHAFVQFIGSIARGDRSGKTLGFPGPAGTGKTELLYVASNIEKNLAKIETKYQQLSYRFQNLHTIPYLRGMFRYDKKTGEPTTNFINPDMPRSPFTLLREDMQARVIKDTFPKIRKKWGLTISNGWTIPEPKSEEIVKHIFEHEFPEIAQGLMTVDDLTERQYLDTLNKYLVIVPKTLIQPKREAAMIRAQTDNPNWQAMFASVNLGRAALYDISSPLAVDYKGQVFQQDGGLLMFDEMYRNPPELLNVLLEIVQNQIAQTDYGLPVRLDVVPIWNSNDESISKAKEDQALKASLDRTEQRPMRLLLAPNQIEAVSLFQVNIERFKMRKLDENSVVPLEYTIVYPATDSMGKTESAYGRYALYYDTGDGEILIAPMALNYMAWVTSATRFVTDAATLLKFKDELNLVTSDPGLFMDPITRLRIALGDRSVEIPQKMELSRVRDLAHEGETGISSRDVETWLKAALNNAVEDKKTVLTPRMLDITFQQLLDVGTIAPPKADTRAAWQLIRNRVKAELLLPRMERDVKSIISGDGQKAERIYAEVEREFIEIGSNPDATQVMPDDGSQAIIINKERLNEISEIYRNKYGRVFSHNFLLRNLRNARRGQGEPDGQLLDCVREFLSKHDALTADYISSFDSLYKGENKDPAIIEKEGQVAARLHQYGYDAASFKEAVAFVAQLRGEKARRDADVK